MKNKLLLIIFSLFLFLFINIKVEALVEPTNEFYVNDYANILSTDTENYIMNNSVKLASKTNAQIVVVTVKSLEGKDIETYATELFRQFGLGDKNENNGLLILLAPKEREVRIEVGYGLEGVITDGLAGRYLDQYFVPYFKNDNWDKGIKNGYSAIYKKVCDYYEIGTSNVEIDNEQNEETRDLRYYKNLKRTPILNGLFLGFFLGLFIGKKDKNFRNKLIALCLLVLLANINIYHICIDYYNTHSDAIREFVYALGIEFTIATVTTILTAIFIAPRIKRNNSSGEGYLERSDHDISSFDSGGYSGGGGSSGGGGASRSF